MSAKKQGANIKLPSELRCGTATTPRSVDKRHAFHLHNGTECDTISILASVLHYIVH